MKKVLPLLLAVMLFFTCIIGYSHYSKNKLSLNNSAIGYVRDSTIFLNHDMITSNLDENTILVFGSSEFSSEIDTEFHPRNLFQNKEFQMNLIGGGHFQSLSHAITLGACDNNGLKNNKIVLVLSPQWFSPEGLSPDTVPSRFSEKNFIAFLQNKKISLDTRQKVSSRINELLESTDPTTFNRIEKYQKSFLNGTASLSDSLYSQTYSNFLSLKSNVQCAKRFKEYRVPSSKKQNPPDITSPNWGELSINARKYGKSMCTNNDFFINDNYFTTYVLPALGSAKDGWTTADYSISKEFDDLRLFLSVCKELNIEPLLINIPVKGVWYDYRGFPKENRQKYYQNVRDIANEYSVELADFSSYEYSNYFLSDIMHLGWEGWVKVNESIYNFAKKDS